jgi:hypothetical protein
LSTPTSETEVSVKKISFETFQNITTITIPFLFFCTTCFSTGGDEVEEELLLEELDAAAIVVTQ